MKRNRINAIDLGKLQNDINRNQKLRTLFTNNPSHYLEARGLKLSMANKRKIDDLVKNESSASQKNETRVLLSLTIKF